jgi:hypothetical protein
MNLGKTPWVDRTMTDILPQLRQRVPATWLPRMITEETVEVQRGPWGAPVTTFETRKFPRPVVEEYGCGSYGCVMPTHEPGLVIKLTTDMSEAWFISRAMSLEETTGIVTYKGLYALSATDRYGRQIFVLWRTEARDVGAWDYARTHKENSDYARRVDREAMGLLGSFKEWASIARDYLQPKLKAAGANSDKRHKILTAAWKAYERAEPEEGGRGTYRSANARGMAKVGIALRTCLELSQEMQGNPSLYNVGEALGHFLENGIVLADVHSNNLGLAFDEDEGSGAIITDPGHAVEFSPQWSEPAKVEML